MTKHLPHKLHSQPHLPMETTSYGKARRTFRQQNFGLCSTTYYSTVPITCTQTRIHHTQSLHYDKSLKCSSLRHTVLCKSNANDNRRISRFVLAIYCRYISETSHGLPNVETINHRDISTIFAISPWDIVLARLRCNDISQSRTIYHHDISLQRSSL